MRTYKHCARSLQQGIIRHSQKSFSRPLAKPSLSYKDTHLSNSCAKPSLGFTLIESLVVVVIVGILMAIAAPGWLTFLNARTLNTAQDQAFQEMRQAQSEAIRHHLNWQASFRQSNGTVQVATHSATAIPSGAQWKTLPSGVYIDLAETTLYASGSLYRLQFNDKGQINGQLGKITFTSSSVNRLKRCVIVSTLLGTLRKAENRATPDSSNRFCY